MDLEKLAKIIEGDINKDELFDFFNLKEKEEAIELWKNNLLYLKFEWNDLIGYESLKLLHEKTWGEDNNIFYQELIKESLFLRTFCNYNTNLISAFINMIGVLEFIYITREHLKTMPQYVFFLEMFDEYKKDLRSLSEWKTSQKMLETMEQASNIDTTGIIEANEILSKLKDELLPEE